MTARAETRAGAAGTRPADSLRVSVVELVEVGARQADELAGQAEAAQRAVAAQLEQLDRARAESGRLDEVAGSACWLGATLRVLAGSLGELHTLLDEAAQLARVDQPDASASARVPGPRPCEPGTPSAADEVVAGAAGELYGLRHRLGPDVLRSLAGIWACASAARHGEPAEVPWTFPGMFTGHDVTGCESDDGKQGGDRAGEVGDVGQEGA